jgi:hypothetical protein
MSLKDKVGEVSEAELDEALRNFRLHTHTRSDAAYSQPRTAVAVVRRQVWRLATVWALGCVLIAGGISAGVREHRQKQMKITAARVAEQERQVVEERNRQLWQTDEELLAKVDSDVSREVPSAMEPLAQLMAEDQSQ